MLELDISVAKEVVNRIKEKYPSLEIRVYYEDKFDNYFVAIEEEDIYYSKEYLSLVTDIEIEYLWERNIFNYLFVCEDESCCGTLVFNSASSQLDVPAGVSSTLHFTFDTRTAPFLNADINNRSFVSKRRKNAKWHMENSILLENLQPTSYNCGIDLRNQSLLNIYLGAIETRISITVPNRPDNDALFGQEMAA